LWRRFPVLEVSFDARSLSQTKDRQRRRTSHISFGSFFFFSLVAAYNGTIPADCSGLFFSLHDLCATEMKSGKKDGLSDFSPRLQLVARLSLAIPPRGRARLSMSVQVMQP
jgi:hypothetical protein